jgi:DNA helicase II / ATP-dependent DNA helicase PcrA
MTPPDPLLGHLNPAQLAAVTHRGGPLLIVAGAGTGKTRVLSHRIAWLIREEHCKPDEVLALAFNEKAAREMEERVDELLPYGTAPTGILTFHAFGQQILEEHGLRLGLSGPGEVLSGAALLHHLKSRLWDLPLQRFRPLGHPSKHAKELAKAFSRAKDEGLSPDDWAQAAMLQRDEARTPEQVEDALDQLELAGVYKAYQGLLRADGFLDHGDQLLLALQLFQEHPAVLQRVRQAWRVVLVDEFQDTNTVQSRLIQLLCPPSEASELTVVGDDDQAIYGFRGASLANLLHFKDAYPAARVVTLTQNYRSAQPILDAAYKSIRHNDPERLEVSLSIDKKLQGQHADGSVEHKPFADRNAELAWVAGQILAGVAQGIPLKDQAVLVRSHGLGQEAMDVLTRAGIPLRYPGDRGLYRQPEVQRALAFVRALGAPHEDPAIFDLLIHAPGPWDLLSIKHLLGVARQRKLPLWRALGDPGLLQAAGLGPDAAAAGQALLGQLRELGKVAVHQGVAPALYSYLQQSGVLQRLLNAQDDQAERSVANLARFFERLKDFDKVERAGNVPAVSDYLDALLEEGDDPASEQAGPDEDAVTVSTVHQAKGLEWPVVFVIGMDEGSFPQTMKGEGLGLPPSVLPAPADRRTHHRAEERRLFYVAMTRAKQRLVLSHALDHGGKKAWKRSTFLSEALDLPPEPKAPAKLSPKQRLDSFAEHPHPLHRPLSAKLDEDGALRLTYYPTDDYLTCPFKYKIAHVLELKPPPAQSLGYGNTFHTAIQAYHRARMDGLPFGYEDLEAAFLAAWSSVGFDSPEHEAQRKQKGLQQLRVFFDEEEASGLLPWRIEHKFDAPLDPHTRLVGRMDRVDKLPDGRVLISDYKTSSVKDQKDADEEVKKSLQLAIYALAHQSETGQLPDLLELRFLEHGLRAQFTPDAKYIEKKREEILEAARGIRAGEFGPTPGFHCRFCAYSGICPHAEGKK